MVSIYNGDAPASAAEVVVFGLYPAAFSALRQPLAGRMPTGSQGINLQTESHGGNPAGALSFYLGACGFPEGTVVSPLCAK
jgi:hypothetical protein